MSHMSNRVKAITTETGNMDTGKSASILDYLRVLPQCVVPRRLLSRLTWRITRCECKPVKNCLIRLFISWFRVDMSIAVEPDYHNYKHFNAFFTRALKPESRIIENDNRSIISPVDGIISQLGRIVAGEIFQAKGRSFDLQSLLAGEQEMAGYFQDGLFITLYLSPRNYHRIHMPVDGKLTKMIHVPGSLFAVNQYTTRVINRLFARNERVISLFATRAGCMGIVMVGAINVSSLETVWAGEITPAAGGTITRTDYRDGPAINLARGQELGRFNMGSTVIVLFGGDAVTWAPALKADDKVCMGMEMGRMVNA